MYLPYQTISAGANQNSDSTETTGNALPSGSSDNLRWEITNVDQDQVSLLLILDRVMIDKLIKLFLNLGEVFHLILKEMTTLLK
jgi:hypothetical protein